MKCEQPSARTGKPCAMPAGHPREQHLDDVEVRAEIDGMAASFAMGFRSGLRDAQRTKRQIYMVDGDAEHLLLVSVETDSWLHSPTFRKTVHRVVNGEYVLDEGEDGSLRIPGRPDIVLTHVVDIADDDLRWYVDIAREHFAREQREPTRRDRAWETASETNSLALMRTWEKFLMLTDGEQEAFLLALKHEFCIHCGWRRRGETCHCTNDE